jgi:hypothetical protein
LPAQRVLLWQLFFEIEIEQQANMAAGAMGVLPVRAAELVRLLSVWSFLVIGFGIIGAMSVAAYFNNGNVAVLAGIVIGVAFLVLLIGVISSWVTAHAAKYQLDRLLVVAELIDPTRGSVARLTWLVAFVLYGLLSAAAVGLRVMTNAQLIQGALLLLGMFGMALALGAVLPVRRESVAG